jgi:hypothetical protein
MSLGVLRSVLGWCAIINYGVLLWWFLVFRLAHNWLYHFHGRWFPMSLEEFNVVHYGGMAVYKIGLLLFNVVPWVALVIVSGRAEHNA